MIKILIGREIYPDKYNASKIRSNLRKRPCIIQSLSTLFPTLRSRYDTVILGFTPCGNYLVTYNTQALCFHDLILSSDSIAVSNIRNVCQLLLPSNTQPLASTAPNSSIHRYIDSLLTCVVEVIMTNNSNTMLIELNYPTQPFYLLSGDVSLTQGVEKLQYVYHNGNAVYIDVSSVLQGYSRLFSVGMGVDIAVINDLYYIKFIATGNINSLSQSHDSFNLISGAKFNHTRLWEAINSDNHSSLSHYINTSQVQVNIFRGDIAAQLLFKSYHKDELSESARVLHTLADYNTRVIGPYEGSLYFMIVISLYVHRSNESPRSNDELLTSTIATSYLLVCNPWDQRAILLRVCDLHEFGKKINKPYPYESILPVQDTVIRRNDRICLSWFNAIMDVYCKKLIQFYPSLRWHYRNMKTLSNHSVEDGVSLSFIDHPILPITIVHDEDNFIEA